MKYALLIYAASTDRTPEPRLGEGVIDNWRGGLAVSPAARSRARGHSERAGARVRHRTAIVMATATATKII